MNASFKTLIAMSVAVSAAVVMTVASAYAPDRGEPMPTVEAEIALAGFIQAGIDRNFQWNGEPIATVEAEIALTQFMQMAQAMPASDVAVEASQIKTVSFQDSGEPVATQAAGDALTAFVNQLNNNCQPADAKFGCVNDSTKPSPLPGKSLWSTTN